MEFSSVEQVAPRFGAIGPLADALASRPATEGVARR
jgi:hypothetical protein